jgi:hypothetical protein
MISNSPLEMGRAGKEQGQGCILRAKNFALEDTPLHPSKGESHEAGAF